MPAIGNWENLPVDNLLLQRLRNPQVFPRIRLRDVQDGTPEEFVVSLPSRISLDRVARGTWVHDTHRLIRIFGMMEFSRLMDVSCAPVRPADTGRQQTLSRGRGHQRSS